MKVSIPFRASLTSYPAMLRRVSEPSLAMLSQVVTSGGNFLTSAIIVRTLGLTEFGRFAVAVLLIMIMRNVLNGVVLVPMSVIAPKLRTASAAAYRGFLLANGLAFSVGASLLLFLLAHFSGELLGVRWIGEFAVALVLANFTSNMADFFRRYEFSRFRPAMAVGIDTVRCIVQLAVLGALASVWRANFTPETALQAISVGGLVASLLGLLLYGTVRWRRIVARALWPRHWRFIIWMLPGVVLEAVQANSPLLIGGAVLGEDVLGGVRAVQQLANILSLPTNALQQVAPAMASRRFRESGTTAMARLLTWLSIAGLAILLASSALIAALWSLVSQLLFHSQDVHLLQIFLLYSVVNVSSLVKQMIFIYLQSAEDPRAVLETNLIAAIGAPATVFVLLKMMGDLAIPSASLIVAFMTIVFLGARAKRPHSRQLITNLTARRSST